MDSQPPPLSFIDGPNGRLAFRRRPGLGPGLVWLGGFNADMRGNKAMFFDGWARRKGRAFLRFDYSGHGESERAFEDGCVSDWLADALAVFDAQTNGAQVLIGSSMGAWIAALLALQRPQRLAGILFIAPAADFTEDLIWRRMDDASRERLLRDGRIEEPSANAGQPTAITRKLIDDGRRHLLLGAPIAIDCPVRIVHGMADADVPWRHGLRFAERLASNDLEVTLIKAGDHRLSTPGDLGRLAAILDALSPTPDAP